MKKWKVFCFLFLACVCLCMSSCRTVVTEYVPMKIDLTDVVDPVLQHRPDNSEIKVVTDIEGIEDIIINMTSYLYAWDMWEAYADSLEKTLISIRDDLK